jgi:hypothetical protein
MAHAYTTKRGKNKMSKLGVRKDHQQNGERGLKKSGMSSLLFDGPKESIFTSIGHVGTTSRITSMRERVQKSLVNKCSYPDCKSSCSDGALFDCSACKETRYCGRDCQLNHWDAHKERCKERRREMKEKDKEIALQVSSALSELNLVENGLQSLQFSSTNENDGKNNNSSNKEIVKDNYSGNIIEIANLNFTDIN